MGTVKEACMKPLLLVHCEKKTSTDEDSKLILNEEQVAILLKKVGDRPLSIFCLAGPQQTNMNLVFGYMVKYLIAAENENADWIDWEKKDQPLTEFQWPSSSDGGLEKSPDFPGIWCCNRPFILSSEEGKEVAVVLLYAQSSDKWYWTMEDSALMGLAIVASSCTIFNFQSHMSEKCLSALASHVKYAVSGILGKKTSPISDMEKLRAFLGKAVVVIRDWNFPTVSYPYGVAGGSKFLNEEKLREKPQHSKDSRLARVLIKKLFEDVSGCLLPFAGLSTLKPEFEGCIGEMETIFVEKLADFISEVVNLDDLPMKRNNKGDTIGGLQWKALLEKYLSSVNSGVGDSGTRKILTMVGIKDNMLVGEQKEVMKMAMKVYGDAWKGLLVPDARVVKEVELKDTHKRAKKKALEAFQKGISGGCEEDEDDLDEDNEENEGSDSVEEHLKGILEERFREIKQANERKRMENLEKNKMEMIKQYEESMTAMFPLDSDEIPHESRVRRESEEIMKDILRDFERKCAQKDMETEREKFLEQLKNAEKKVMARLLKRGGSSRNNADNEDSFSGRNNSETPCQSMNWSSVETIPCATVYSADRRELGIGFSGDSNVNTGILQTRMPLSSFGDIGHPTAVSMGRRMMEPPREETRAIGAGTRKLEEERRRQKSVTCLIERLKRSYAAILAANENADEDTEKDKILAEYDEDTPYPEDSENFKLYREMLKAELEMSKAEVSTKRKQVTKAREDNLSRAVKDAVENYQSRLQTYLTKEGLTASAAQMGKESSIILKGELNKLTKKFSSKELQKIKEKLETEAAQVYENLMQENEDRGKQQLVGLMTSSKELYMDKMSDALNRAKCETMLQISEGNIRQKIVEQFRKNSAPLRVDDEPVQKLEDSLTQVFLDLKRRFEAKMEGEAGMSKLSVANARVLYCEEMEKHLRNHQSVSNEELEKMHSQALIAASDQVDGEEQAKQLRESATIAFQKYLDQNKMNMKGEPAIGIDLGTTFSCASVFQQGQVKIIPNSVGKMTTPSYVLFNSSAKDVDQRQIVGEEAKQRAYESPDATIFDAKRILGRKFTDKELQDDMKLWAFSVVDGGRGVPMIEINGTRHNPEVISAVILRQLKKDAEVYLKREVKKAVITVPAYFTDGQKQATEDAAKMAGLEVLALLTEPVAAAMAYNLQYTSVADGGVGQRHILVFDLGGGTFDVAVLKVDKGEIEVLTVEGDAHLGGEDFDKSMMVYCAEQFKKKHNVDLFQGKDSRVKTTRDNVRRQLKRLQAECERQKISLGTARSATVSVKKIYNDLDLSVRVMRATFEKINEDKFSQTIEVVKTALLNAKLKKTQIDDIVLVGGSTRIPKIQTMLQNFFDGKTLDKKINPDEAVAYGAALFAAIKKGDVTKDSANYTKIQDVTPMSVGVEVYGGGFATIIPKNTKIPVMLKETYKTAHKNQTSVQITIYQGEDPIAVENEKIGDFYLNGIPPNDAGAENIEVEMVINEQGIIHVTAKCTSTGQSSSMSITVTENKQRMGQASIQRYLAGIENVAAA